MQLELENDELNRFIYSIREESQISAREILWEWALSRVERIYLTDGSSLILKRSASPLTDEARIIESISDSDISLANLYTAEECKGVLTMLMEDLGPSVRGPSLLEAASAAARTHAAPSPERLRVLDERGLQELPTSTLQALDELVCAGRWRDTERLREQLSYIEEVGRDLSRDAQIPPFGLCHSEFHPSSLHIGKFKSALVDWARAFTGPGLIDIISYFGTLSVADPTTYRSFIDDYVNMGGAPTAGDDRAGYRAEEWGLFWHRIWVAEWFTTNCTSWMTDTRQDEIYQQAVERHVGEAYAIVR